MKPAYNHDRKDSPLSPCEFCAQAVLTENAALKARVAELADAHHKVCTLYDAAWPARDTALTRIDRLERALRFYAEAVERAFGGIPSPGSREALKFDGGAMAREALEAGK